MKKKKNQTGTITTYNNIPQDQSGITSLSSGELANMATIAKYKTPTPAPSQTQGLVINKNNDWEDIIGTMPSITGEQQDVSTPLSEYLTEALAGIGNQPTFEEWSQQEGNVPSMFGGELGGQAQSAYSEALSGAFPESYFQRAIYDPMVTQFTQDIMPAIKESYVGTGAITGTEVGDRLGREAGRMQEGLMGTRATLAQQAKERSYQAASQYQTHYQNTLNTAYDNYIKQNPAASDILQAALSYLNIPMMAAYQKPEKDPMETRPLKYWDYKYVDGQWIPKASL